MQDPTRLRADNGRWPRCPQAGGSASEPPGGPGNAMTGRACITSIGVGLTLLCVTLSGCQRPPQATPLPADLPVARRLLRVGVSETSPPVIFEDGRKVLGIEADLARAMGRELDREIEFVSMFWPNLLLELQGGRIDIVMSGVSVTERRKARVAFADPYMVTGQQAMVRRGDLETLGHVETLLTTRRRIGAEVGTTAMHFVRRNMTRANIARFSTVARAMAALDDGEIDAVVHDAPSIQWHAARDFDGRLAVVPGLMTREAIAWAVNKEDHRLLEDVNRLLAQWRHNGTLDAIIARWLPEQESHDDDP